MKIHYADSYGWVPKSLLPLGRPVRRFVPAEDAEEILQVLKRTVKELQFCLEEKHYPSKQLIKELQSIIKKAEVEE